MASPLIPLGPGVFRIPTAGDYVNSYAFLEDDGSVTLVDTGLRFAPSRIVAALASIGRRPQDVARIVLTHAHVDHAGGARRMLEETGLPGVAIHADDADFLRTGTAPPTDATLPGGQLFARMPSGGFKSASVAQVLRDGDVLPVAGGIQVIHTPGHTPGHVSLLHPASGVLITGDSLFNVRSRLSWSVSLFCTSFAQAKASAQRLADLDYSVVAFMHGPELSSGGREAVRGFLRREQPR